MQNHNLDFWRLIIILRILVICIVSALIIGLLPVFLEYAVVRLQGRPLNSRAFLLAVYPLYAFLTLIPAVAFGLLLSGLHLGGVFSGKIHSTLQLVLSVLLTGCVFVVVTMHINMQFLPELKELSSILGNMGLILSIAGLGYLLYRFWGFLFSRISPWIPAGAVAIILIAGGLLLYRTPIGASGKIPERVSGNVTGPDVILVTIDTLRADHLSCFGYSRETSPFIDELAGQGVLFTNHIAASSWTRPSTASLLTSLYPSGHQTIKMNSRLPEGVVSLSEVMKREGYVTGIFSANGHISPTFGFEQGVDYFFQTRWRSMIKFTGLYRLTTGFIKPFSEWANENKWIRSEGKDIEDDRSLLNKFIKWYGLLEGKPFFAYLHFNAPHTTYEPPAPYSSMFTESNEKLDFKVRFIHQAGECDEKWPPRVQQRQVALYDGEIAYVDTLIHKLVKTVDTDNRPRDLLFILVSDHGEEFYEHCMYGHGLSLYQELVRVPGIIYYPGKIKAGMKVKHPVSMVDFAPTILSLAGLPPQDAFMGQNLAPYLLGNNKKLAPQAYSELLSTHNLFTVIDKHKNKLIRTEADGEVSYELYDLEADPEEKENLLLDENYKPVKTELKKKLSQLRELAAMPSLDKEEIELDEATRERLKALGYVQ